MGNSEKIKAFSIRKKLLVLVLAVLLPASALLVMSNLAQRRNAIENAEHSALMLAQGLAAQQEQVAFGVKMMLSTLAQLPEVRRLDAEASNVIFRELQSRHPLYSIIAAATPDGNLFAASASFEPGSVNVADRRHIREAVRTMDFAAGEYVVTRIGKFQSINYAYPVLDEARRLVAIAIVGVKLDEYSRLLTKSHLSDGSAVIITDHAGVRLFRFPENEAASVGKAIPEQAFKTIAGDREQGFYEMVAADGIDRLNYFKQLRLREDLPPYLFVVAGMAKATILHKANRELLWNLSVLGVVALMALAMAWTAARFTVIKPLEQLLFATRRFGRGEMTARTGLAHSSDELGQLAHSFDHMASMLEERDLERKSAERVLRRFELVALHGRDIILFLRREDGRILEANEAAVKAYGYSREELLLRSIHDLRIPETRHLTEGLLAKADSDGILFESIHLRKDASSFPVEVSAQGATIEGERMVVSVIRDISERKEAEKALRETERRYRTVADYTYDWEYWIGPDGKMIYVSPSCERITGYSAEEFIQDPTLLASIIHPGDQERMAAHLAGDGYRCHEVCQEDFRIVTKEGEARWIHHCCQEVESEEGACIGKRASNRDITERVKTREEKVKIEAQLRHAQKMEAIGNLAGGIAHDFNNILSPIMGFTQLALVITPQEGALKEYLDDILASAHRAKDLVRQILSFCRGTEQGQHPVAATPIVKEVLKLLRASLPSTIEIHQENSLEKGRDFVLADPIHVHQMLMNLCTNAGHAMKNTGGALDVRLSEVHGLPARCASPSKAASGPYLELSVGDTGHGMENEVMERIFEPYFTTKGQEEGTGLGLSVVHGIVKGYGGEILVESTPGGGSVFTVYLPLLEEKSAIELLKAELVSRGAGQRILVVDDEPMISKMTKLSLEELGYQVVSYQSSEEALEAFRRKPHAFDLVITDHTMPKMTGLELARELIRLRPDVPVLLYSGLSEKPPVEEFKKVGIHEFLYKPAVLSELSQAVQRVLGSRVSNRMVLPMPMRNKESRVSPLN